MDKLIDAHSHINRKTPINNLYNTYKFEDILDINSSTAGYNSVGVHPRFIDNINWDKIEAIIKADNKLFIGEVGLDRYIGNKKEQLEVFKRFINLSVEFNRNLNIHCVKSWGSLFQCLEKFNRDIPHIYHGFSGSLESLKIALKGRSYFSFSLRELERDKLERIIKAVPVDRVLIESDMLIEEYDFIGSSEYCNRVLSSYKILQEILSIGLDELIEIIYNNFNSYLGER